MPKINPFDLSIKITAEKVIEKSSESYTSVCNIAKLLERLSELQDEQAKILGEIWEQYACITLTTDISDISYHFGNGVQ